MDDIQPSIPARRPQDRVSRCRLPHRCARPGTIPVLELEPVAYVIRDNSFLDQFESTLWV